MLKAAAGGGGRGMRRVDDPAELRAALAAAGREALAAFGDGTLYVERLIAPARHVEVQLLGDRHGGLAVLGERECSVQRRHQKLVEETPSPAVTPRPARGAGRERRRVAGTVDFHSAATVEFLLDADGGHYFLEMNTRLQVEHGVTELVTGIDLVAWQIRVAEGSALDASVLEPRLAGHAIEVRIYAEDPYHGISRRRSAPSPPGGCPMARAFASTPPSPRRPLTAEYDPLLAKLMVHAQDRPAAVAACDGRSMRRWSAGSRRTSASTAGWSTIRASSRATTTLASSPGLAGGGPARCRRPRPGRHGGRSKPGSRAPPRATAGRRRHGPTCPTGPGWRAAARCGEQRRMTDYEVRYDGDEVQPAAGWTLEWVDRRARDRAAVQRAGQPAGPRGRGGERVVRDPGAGAASR